MERAFHCKGDGGVGDGCHGGAVLLLMVELVTMTLLLMDGYDGDNFDVVTIIAMAVTVILALVIVMVVLVVVM